MSETDELVRRATNQFTPQGHLRPICRQLVAELTRLQAERERLREALRLTEFGFNHARCPACFGWDGKSENDKIHSKGCPVSAALADAEAKEQTP